MTSDVKSVSIPPAMKAVVCHGVQDYRLEEAPTPTVGPGEVLLRIHACGICASDLKCYNGAPLFWGDDARPQFIDGPVIPGHEFVGEVVALGEGAEEKRGLSIGDMAVAEQIVPCWKCRYCLRGQYWVCAISNVFGFQKTVNGAMTEYMKVPERAIVHKVPKSIPAKKAAVIEPLACAIHAVERGEIKLGDVVVIAGCGTLGLSMVGAARLKTPGTLIAMDLADFRLEVAKRMGADLTINPDKEDAVQHVRDLTEGYGCDVYIEATGSPEAVVAGLHMIRKLGTFVEFSLLKKPVTVDWTIIGDAKELNIHGSHLGPYSYPIAIDYIERGLIDVEQVVTHEFSLDDFEKGFSVAANPAESMKVLLRP
ncbi:alcohol dehydrogenase catalytic domain-containing protein [Candidatus Hydrogenedentota bacterium]